MVGVARDIAARGTVNGHSLRDFIKIPVAPLFEPERFLGANAGAFVFGDFFTLPDRPDGKETEAGKRAADAE